MTLRHDPRTSPARGVPWPARVLVARVVDTRLVDDPDRAISVEILAEVANVSAAEVERLEQGSWARSIQSEAARGGTRIYEYDEYVHRAEHEEALRQLRDEKDAIAQRLVKALEGSK